MMINLRSIIKNIFSLFAAKIIIRFATAFFAILLIRYLGKVEYGTYSKVLSFATILLIFSDFGFGQLIIRNGSRDKSTIPPLFGQSFIIKAIAIIILIGLGIIITKYVLNYNFDEFLLAIILILFTFFKQLILLANSIFQAIEKMQFIAYFNIVLSVFLALSTLATIYFHKTIMDFGIYNAIAGFISVVITFAFVFKSFLPKFSLHHLKDNLNQALPFGFGYVLLWLYLQSSVFILSLFNSDAVVGNYASSFRIILILFIIPGLINQALYPILYKTSQKSNTDHKDLVTKLLKLQSVLGFTISFVFFGFKNDVIFILFGESFASSVEIFAVLIWLVFFQAINNPLGDFLTTRDLQIKRVQIQTATLIISLTLQFVLSIYYGAEGMAWALLLTELAMAALYTIFISRLVHYRLHIKSLHTSFISIFIAVLVYIMLSLLDINNVVSICLSVFVIFAVFMNSERAMLKRMIEKW